MSACGSRTWQPSRSPIQSYVVTWLSTDSSEIASESRIGSIWRSGITSAVAPSDSSSLATVTALSRGRVTTIRRPSSGRSDTGRLQDLIGACRERLPREALPELVRVAVALDANDVPPVD